MHENLREIFDDLELGTQKWDCYFPIYERHFSKFVGKAPTVLEIGVDRGGSLEMWLRYFGAGAKIIGVDKKPVEVPGTQTIAADAYVPGFMRELHDLYGPFDIIIDDGSHKMNHQRLVVEEMFPKLRSGGVMLIEDVHTSYWSGYGGGLARFGTFMEYAKSLTDELNFHHTDKGERVISPTIFTSRATGIHFHDSMVVIECGTHEKPIPIMNHGKQ